MAHGGPLTHVQKKMMALHSEPARIAQPFPTLVTETVSSTAPTSLHTEVDKQPLITFGGDIDMPDVPNYPFSAAAKPFVFPAAITPTTVNMAPPAPAPAKRLAPHLRHAATPAPTVTVPITSPPVVSASATSVPIKSEPPVSPTFTEHSTAPSSTRPAGPHARLGPHSKMGPHAKQAPHTQRPQTQTEHPVSPTRSWDDLSKTQTATNTWVDVQKPQISTHAVLSESVPVSRPMKSSQGVWDDIQQLQPDSVHQEPQVKVESEAEPIVEHLPAPNFASSMAEEQPSSGSTIIPGSSKTNNGTSRFGRNDWFPMLLDMKDTEKGRQLIRAFADHIHASVDASNMTGSVTNTDPELLMEFPGGQCLPAAVPQDATVSEIIEEFADMTECNESEVRIVLKIGVKGHGD